MFDDSFRKVMFDFKSYCYSKCCRRDHAWYEIIYSQTIFHSVYIYSNSFLFFYFFNAETDVVGVLVSHYKPEEIDMNGINTRLVDIVLQDLE